MTGGGGFEKFTVHLLNTKKPCSVKGQSIFCSAQPQRTDEASKKISDSYENFEQELSYVPGIEDLNCNAVVRLGNMHAVVPKHTLPLE